MMANGRPCDRPIYKPPSGFHETLLVCLMHSRDPDKDDAAFQREFARTLEEAGDGTADFTFLYSLARTTATKPSGPSAYSSAAGSR